MCGKLLQACAYLRNLTGVIKFLVCHPNVEIPARRAAREGKPMSPAEIDEARKTVASGMGDIQAGGKQTAANKAKMEDYNKMPLKKDKGGLGFTIVGGSDTDLVRISKIQGSLFTVCSGSGCHASTNFYGPRHILK